MDTTVAWWKEVVGCVEINAGVDAGIMAWSLE